MEPFDSKHILLMRYLAHIFKELNAHSHVYVVGGAVRNFVLGTEIKDVDIMVDKDSLGRNAKQLSNQICDVSLFFSFSSKTKKKTSLIFVFGRILTFSEF